MQIYRMEFSWNTTIFMMRFSINASEALFLLEKRQWKWSSFSKFSLNIQLLDYSYITYINSSVSYFRPDILDELYITGPVSSRSVNIRLQTVDSQIPGLIDIEPSSKGMV